MKLQFSFKDLTLVVYLVSLVAGWGMCLHEFAGRRYMSEATSYSLSDGSRVEATVWFVVQSRAPFERQNANDFSMQMIPAVAMMYLMTLGFAWCALKRWWKKSNFIWSFISVAVTAMLLVFLVFPPTYLSLSR
jgi:hypothetical protein